MAAEIRIGNLTNGLLLKEFPLLDGATLPALVYNSTTGEVKYRSIASGGVTPISNILYWNPGSSYYSPYSAKQAFLSFYSGTTDPTLTTRLNLDGYLYLTKLAVNTLSSGNGVTVKNYGSGNGIDLFATAGSCAYINGTLGAEGITMSMEDSGTGISMQTNDASIGINVQNYSTESALYLQRVAAGMYLEVDDSYSGTGATITKSTAGTALSIIKSGTITTTGDPLVLISRTVSGSNNQNTDLLKIVDNPTSSGTILGSSIKGVVGSTTRFDFNPRVATGASAIAYTLDTHNNLTTTGAKLLSLKNQGVEKTYIDKDGDVWATDFHGTYLYLNSTTDYINYNSFLQVLEVNSDDLFHIITPMTVIDSIMQIGTFFSASTSGMKTITMYKSGATDNYIAIGNGTTGLPNTTNGSLYGIDTTGKLWISQLENLDIGVKTNNTENFRFTAAGQFHAKDDIVAFSTTPSDRRLKENIEYLDSITTLDKVCSLRATTFNIIGQDTKRIGFIAQDVEEVIPELIVEIDNVLGQETLSEGKYKTVKYQEIIPLLVEAIKALNNKLNSL